MKLCDVCQMRHLAARYLRMNKEFSHVVDPYLDLRSRFADMVGLEKNIRQRNADFNVLCVASNYMKWWSCFRAYHDVKKDDNELKWKTRSLLLDNVDGLLEALKLPNFVDSEPIQRRTSDIKSTAKFSNFNRFNVLRKLQLHLNVWAHESFENNSICFSPPCIVRPAIIDACNLDVENFPQLADGDHTLCLPGISLPSMISCFVKKRLGSTVQWPITLYSTGESYSFDKKKSKYSQHSVFCLLNLYRDETERFNWETLALKQLENCFASLPLIDNNLRFENVNPSMLKFAESAAACWKSTEDNPLARFSRLGNYISSRVHIKFTASPNNNDSGTANIIDFVGLNFVEIDLSSVIEHLNFEIKN